jgi:hypothetical protein
MSNAHTDAIERNHYRQRHWFGRFKRKSIMVSKSKEMEKLGIDITLRQNTTDDPMRPYLDRRYHMRFTLQLVIHADNALMSGP